MYMEIITGSIGSGKSSYLYDSIKNNLTQKPNSDAILIVPEQFSYTAEKTLLSSFGGLGLNKVEVITFSRLCNRYLKQQNSLLASGKMMLIKKSSSNLEEDNTFYLSSKRHGFTESMSELFSELKRYNISPDDFESIEITDDLTAKKIASINAIYKSYTEKLENTFFDDDDSLLTFANLVINGELFKNTTFYIDDYNDFMPQHYAVIKALLQQSLGVFLTLGLDENNNSNLFLPTKKTQNRLFSIAESVGIIPKITKLNGSADYIKADDIRFLLENWDMKPKYPKASHNISVFNALDVYSEVEHTASQIITLVRDKGYRFRDIGVICGDMEHYLFIISSVFADFGIPFFADEKISVSQHPIAKAILSLFDIINNNWSYDSVFGYLRLGYIYFRDEDNLSTIAQEDIDLLENYVLLHGIKGKKMWFEPWVESGETVFDDIISNYSCEEFDLDKLNLLREKIIAPFKSFLENKGRTATAIAEAVFNFICDINLYDGLLLECKNFDLAGLRDESEQYKQVWNYVIETLDQLVSVLGGGAISRETFSEYFSCGLSGCQISIIPSGLDRVSLGTVSRNSPARVKVLFILGATQGQIPKSVSENAILSDFDRTIINSALSSQKKELAPDNINRLLLENLKLYRTFTTATEMLFISCPSTDNEGNPIPISNFVLEIVEMFDIKVKDNIVSKPSAEELITSSKRGFYYLLLNYAKLSCTNTDKIWSSVYNWYAKNPAYKDKLSILENAGAYKKVQPTLSKIRAEMLYGKDKKYSITSLEKYEKCPFAYYLEKGMRLTVQAEKSIEKSHIGSLVHAAICEFCKAVEDGSTSIAEIHQKWCELTTEKSNEILQKVMSDIKQKVLSRARYDINQLEYLLSRCEFTIKNSIETVRKSLSQGKYTAICYEKDFEVNIDWKKNYITLIGTIDRIDVMEDLYKNKLNIRIIDYKTGNKSFLIDAVYNKVDMQLVLYAIAASKMAESGILTGKSGLSPCVNAILYDRIHDPELKVIKEDQVEAVKKAAETKNQLNGLIILDKEDNENSDSAFIFDSINDMDNHFSEKSSSDFLPISLTQKGDIKSRSSVTSRKEFEILSRYIKKAVIDADKNIKSGKIDINPYKCGESTPCQYCDFYEVCLFDAKLDGYRLSKKAENAFDFMQKEVEDDE